MNNSKLELLNQQFFQIIKNLNKHLLMFLVFSLLNCCLYAQNNDCTNSNAVAISFTFDNYPGEISWRLVDENGDAIASGGNYRSEPGDSPRVENVCLPDGCYDFVIEDSFGDGMCCQEGNGSYTVTDENRNMLASGGEFETRETTNFCLSGNSNPTCNTVDISITFDNYPGETSWRFDDANGNTVESRGDYRGQRAGSTILEKACLPNGCYDFIIEDTFGDGICCQQGNGSYAITDQFGNALASGGEFRNDEATNFCVSSSNPTTCRQTDSLALVAVYNALEGQSWCPQCNGDFSQPMDKWYGVRLNTNGCVDEINMLDASIGGTLAPEIGNLSEITKIDIFQNSLRGTIPESIGNLKNLEHLSLFSNQLTGEIPSSIGNLTKLEHLSLGDNQLTGEIPASIGNLINLQYVALSFNQLTESIPSAIGGLQDLEFLYLRDNQFTGTMPAWLADMDALSVLTLQNNKLNGCYERNLFQLCNQLNSFFSKDTYISNGNSFALTWEQFCASGSCGDKLSSNSNINIQNYPNPFKDETTISYTLDKKSKVTVKVYNASGEQIDVLINNELQGKGERTTIFNGLNYPAGIYYYSAQSEDNFDFQKMILMK